MDQTGAKVAFSKKIVTEMAAGKPQKQAVAIAYNVQKHKKPKKPSDYNSMARKLMGK